MARTRIALITALAVAAGWLGCAAYEDRIVVRRTRGKVWIEGRREGRLVTKQVDPLTFSDCRVTDVDGEDEGGGEEIWRITTIDGSAAQSELRYGETPAGYAQVTPQADRPPPLRAGGSYRVDCLGRRWMSEEFRVPDAPAKSAK